jgi:hypothetical protein
VTVSTPPANYHNVQYSRVKQEMKQILNGSDDGVQHTELLGFWTFSTVGIQICFRPQVKGRRRHLLSCWAPYKELISITGQPLSDLHSYIITRDHANSAGDNKKVYNKSCDKARTCVELG